MTAAGWSHYSLFGEEITSTAGDNYKSARLYRDADTGLDYAMARYHSATIARFLTSDPLGAACGSTASHASLPSGARK